MGISAIRSRRKSRGTGAKNKKPDFDLRWLESTHPEEYNSLRDKALCLHWGRRAWKKSLTSNGMMSKSGVLFNTKKSSNSIEHVVDNAIHEAEMQEVEARHQEAVLSIFTLKKACVAVQSRERKEKTHQMKDSKKNMTNSSKFTRSMNGSFSDYKQNASSQRPLSAMSSRVSGKINVRQHMAETPSIWSSRSVKADIKNPPVAKTFLSFIDSTDSECCQSSSTIEDTHSYSPNSSDASSHIVYHSPLRQQ